MRAGPGVDADRRAHATGPAQAAGRRIRRAPQPAATLRAALRCRRTRPMRLTILGSGTAIPVADRFPASYLVAAPA